MAGSSKRGRQEALDSIKQMAGEVSEGFCELMERTRSQLGELDPLEAQVSHQHHSDLIILTIKSSEHHPNNHLI